MKRPARTYVAVSMVCGRYAVVDSESGHEVAVRSTRAAANGVAQTLSTQERAIQRAGEHTFPYVPLQIRHGVN
jgi:hypothetical protein